MDAAEQERSPWGEGTLDEYVVEAIARRVVELLQRSPQVRARQRLVSAAEIAERFDVNRQWVYENADRLGAMRLGRGTRPRLRFDLVEVAKRLEPRDESAPGRQRGEPDDEGRIDQKDLIPLRGL